MKFASRLRRYRAYPGNGRLIKPTGPLSILSRYSKQVSETNTIRSGVARYKERPVIEFHAVA